VRQIPNLLSAARLALAPYIFYLLAVREYRAVLVWFGVAAITDALDGFLARRLGSHSRVGAYLDPLADKVLLSGSFLVLALNGAIPVWLAVVVLGRDALILVFAVGAMLVTKTRRSFPPSGWGKLSTIVQMVFVLAAVAYGAGWGDARVVRALEGMTAVLTVWSGANYAWRGLAQRS
jgi:cardiolipin synthase